MPARSPHPEYFELRTRSSFSFLEGASNPEDLITEAANRGHTAIALGDRDGVYGIPRFQQAAVQAGVRAIHGTEVTLQTDDAKPRAAREQARGERDPSLLILAETPIGWRRL